MAGGGLPRRCLRLRVELARGALARLRLGCAWFRIIKYDAKNPSHSQSFLRAALRTVLSGDRLTKAEHLLKDGHYRAAILEAFIVIEMGLRQVADKGQLDNRLSGKNNPMGQIIRKLEEAKILSTAERKTLVEVMRVRNAAVHVGDVPTQEDARAVIAAAKAFLSRFDVRNT